MAAALAHVGHQATDAPSFYLLQPTILAFLSHLHREGRIAHEIVANRPQWRAIGG